jgi:hypothetical protein
LFADKEARNSSLFLADLNAGVFMYYDQDQNPVHLSFRATTVTVASLATRASATGVAVFH